MDPYGNIYRQTDDQLKERYTEDEREQEAAKDRARLDGYLFAEAARTERLTAEQELAELRERVKREAPKVRRGGERG